MSELQWPSGHSLASLSLYHSLSLTLTYPYTHTLSLSLSLLPSLVLFRLDKSMLQSSIFAHTHLSLTADKVCACVCVCHNLSRTHFAIENVYSQDVIISLSLSLSSSLVISFAITLSQKIKSCVHIISLG